MIKSMYLAPCHRKQLSRYKIKKRTELIERILDDPMLSM